jgi:hypothetical protein
MSVSPFVLSSSALARLLATTDRTVRRLARDGVLRRAGTGSRAGFDLRHAVPAYVGHLRQQGQHSADLTEARLKLTEAQRRDLELRTRERARRLLEADEVGAVFDATMVIVGSQLDGLAGRMCNELATITEPAAIRQRLFDECRRIRNAAADQLEKLVPDSEGSGDTAGAESDPAA